MISGCFHSQNFDIFKIRYKERIVSPFMKAVHPVFEKNLGNFLGALPLYLFSPMCG